MPFMQRQITAKQQWLQVETTNGTEIVPAEFVAGIVNCSDVDELPEGSKDFATVQEYTEGEPESWEWVTGYGARLSAPGYLDCTDWTVHETVKDAEAHLEEMYSDEDQDEDFS